MDSQDICIIYYKTQGAVEANQTSSFLSYDPASGDPAILVVKENSQQTTWALTEDCKAIQLQ